MTNVKATEVEEYPEPEQEIGDGKVFDDEVDNPLNNSEKIGNSPIRDEQGRLKKGVVLNPNGRPKGAKNFNTIFEEALKKLADKNNKTPDELDIEVVAKAIELARKGDFRFFKDLQDRRFGKAVETIDHQSKGDKISGNTVEWVIVKGDKEKNEV